MDESASPEAAPAPATSPPRHERLTALIEVLLCSGLPTQLALGALLLGIGLAPGNGALTVPYVLALSLLDTALVTALILLFLGARRERPREVFLGARPPLAEALAGVPLGLMALVLAAVILVTLHELAPWLRTYEQNPLQELIRTPSDVALFSVVVVVAGGVREELQRAFLLTRFAQYLGGPTTGAVATSLAFGAGHYVQGADAAIATGVLGLFWAVVYLRRGSAVAPMVSHSLFNLMQLAQLAVSR